MSKKLEIAYLLLTSNRPLTTKEISARANVERKTVYSAIDALELAGFYTEVIKGNKCEGNKYICKVRC